MESDHLNVPFAEGLYRILISATQSQSIFARFAAFCSISLPSFCRSLHCTPPVLLLVKTAVPFCNS